MSGGNPELLELQEKLELLNTEYDKLNDEWKGKLAAQQDEFQREKYDLLQDSSARLQAAKEDADAKNAEIVAELDKFRRAFTGDPLGWATATDEQGKTYYYNTETGESDYDKPRILEIAEVMQNIDSLDEGKKIQEKAVKKGKEAELHARKLEVSLNEKRAEVAELRKVKKAWEVCGEVLTSLGKTMSAAMDETDIRVTKVEERLPVVERSTKAVKEVTEKMRQVKLELFERGLKIEKLSEELAAANVVVEKTRDKANKLEERFTQAVEERVDEVKLPLEDELAAAYAGHQEEKALREADRRYLADLWPEGWLVPSILRRFRTMTPEERAQQTLKMEEVEAERDLVETIRAGVAAAAKWETKQDDYGREYYANWETGEAMYGRPPEMDYRPPLGRNELGRKVDPRLQSLREWEQGTDGWGKPFWQNARTGEQVDLEPKGWSEAMGLGEHELEGREGPTEGEVARDVAVDAARVVVTWLNKAKEAEERRERAAATLSLSGSGNGDISEEDDEDQDEFVYDIQSVEELAMGDEGWCYQGPGVPSTEEDGNKSSLATNDCHREEETGEQAPKSIAEIRDIIARLARREDRFEKRLTQIRRSLEDLAHDLLAAKRADELKEHHFALGHSTSKETENNQEAENSKATIDPEPTAEVGKRLHTQYRGPEGADLLSSVPRAATASSMPSAIDNGAMLAGSNDRILGKDAEEEGSTPGAGDVKPVVEAGGDGTGRPFGQEGEPPLTAWGISDATSLSGRYPISGDLPVASNSQGKKENREYLEPDKTQAAGEAATEEASDSSRSGNRNIGNIRERKTFAKRHQDFPGTHAMKQGCSSSTLSPPTTYRVGDADVGGVEAVEEAINMRQRHWKTSKLLPDSLAREIGNRAFPLALTAEKQSEGERGKSVGEEKGDEKEEAAEAEEEEEGGGREGKDESSRKVFCAAFHALAAEAVWAGFNGSNRVEKPPEGVWDPRGGDRWGTAAFFAEEIGEREEEAKAGLPGHSKIVMLQFDRTKRGGIGGSCSGEHPVSSSSARHATARALCMAAVSSRRGFLKQAAEEAIKEARQGLADEAEKMAGSNPRSLEGGGGGQEGGDGLNQSSRNDATDQRKRIGRSKGDIPNGLAGDTEGAMAVGERWSVRQSGFQARAPRREGFCDRKGDEEEPVIQSSVMLRFGAEIPPLVAAGKCGRSIQFPIPDDWNDPEAREKHYMAQVARRKETLEALRARDEAPLAKPKGFDGNHVRGDSEGSRRHGCQDARQLLSYEAVVLEEELHQTLVEVNETQSLLEEGRVQAEERWKQLIKQGEKPLADLASEITRQQSRTAKTAMEIRGLRVPLVEPQPPPTPTLDPGKMKPPALVPDAEKMRQDEVDNFTEKIRGGSFDRGEPIVLPQGKTLSTKHLQEVTAVVTERQAEVTILLEEEMLRCNEAMGIYEYKHREWQREEAERKEHLSEKCYESRLGNLHLDSLAEMAKSHKERLELLRVEASIDERISLQSQEAKRRFEATMGREIAEEARAHDWLLRLQVELSDALLDKEALERLPDAALNRLDALRWEKQKADKMIECRRRVAELRECLVEEGRRRRQLYCERKWAAQSELRRVLAERAAVGEKGLMLQLLLKVGDSVIFAKRSTQEAKMKEAAEDKEGVGTEGTAAPGELFSAEREWVSDEFREAYAEQKERERNLAEVVELRVLARRRESTIGALVLGAARGALPPPHPDQWLPKAEQERHEDEVRLLLERHDRELRAKQEAVEACRTEVREAVRDAAILKAKLEAIEGWRGDEILVLRSAGRDAVENLKGILEKERRESVIRIDKLEQALSEIRKEYNEVRAELTARIEKLNYGRSSTAAWVKALRHDLAEERTRREHAEERLAVFVNRAKTLGEKLRTELRAERMHSFRLELWIAALHDEVRLLVKAHEELKRLHELERIEHERRVRCERHKVWRNRTAVRLLCTSVDNLFLFFAQRVANLAGSRRTYNDDLRNNGAVKILAAFCRGPRKDLRRLAARALGALGWNGHTEARVLAWDIHRHWDRWVETCCPAEEERLRRRGETFEDPAEFRHPDEIRMLPSPAGASTPQEKQASGTPKTRILPEKLNQPHKNDDAAIIPYSKQEEEARPSPPSAQPIPDRLSPQGDETLEGNVAASSNSLRAVRAGEGEPRQQGQRPGEGEVEQEGEEDEEEGEFRPRVAMSARTFIRHRRQWALRRARRQEGPNEANQLELGGGSPLGVTLVCESPIESVERVPASPGDGGGEVAEGGGEIRTKAGRGGGGDGDTGGGDRGGEVGVVALLVRLCRDTDDWEVVRAAAAALSVAAYHEENAERMGEAAPDLIPALVNLLPHPDSEVQAHAATTLANLAHGSPTYQSKAGEAGAIRALLDICRGRAGVGGNDHVGNGSGHGNDGALDVRAAESDVGLQAVITTSESVPNRKKTSKSHGSETVDTLMGVGQRDRARKRGGEAEGETQVTHSSKKGTRAMGMKMEGDTGTMTTMDGQQTPLNAPAPSSKSNGDTGEQGQNEIKLDSEIQGDMVMIPERLRYVEDDGGEEGRAAAAMDVDAVQAATAALANLLCYSEANSVRLVAASGIGVLVGLVSSYRPQNLLDFDQAEEIQANAAEALVNATRNHGEEVTARVHALGIKPLVLMCGSENLQVQRHAALVLGNVCQTDDHRATAGMEGAVEGLFALCDNKDGVVRANALWALGNLAWDLYNQERIGRYTSQLLSLASSSWLPVRTNALICLGNALFFHESNRRRVEIIDGALALLLGYCGSDHPVPIREAALRCLVSLTYVDRIVAQLVDAGCVAYFVTNLEPSVPAALRHPAALALLNISVRDLYKSCVVQAGGLEAAVALLGSDDQEERELAARILAALASIETDDQGSDQKEQLDLPHLLGILQMRGNLPAQKAAAEQIAQEVSKDTDKQKSLGEYGGVVILLKLCEDSHSTGAQLLVPVLWGLRNCLQGHCANKDRFVRAGGLETLVKLCQASRSTNEWAVTEAALTTLVTATLGNEVMCRRLLRVGLDQLIDAAEDHQESKSCIAHQEIFNSFSIRSSSTGGGAKEVKPHRSKIPVRVATTSLVGGVCQNMKKKKHHLPAMPGKASASPLPRQLSETADPVAIGPAVDEDLGLDQIDEIGVDGVLRQSSDALTRQMQEESRQTCSALATSLLQALGPFNYVICSHCGAREGGGTTCSQCGYAIKFDFSGEAEDSASSPGGFDRARRVRSPITQGS